MRSYWSKEPEYKSDTCGLKLFMSFPWIFFFNMKNRYYTFFRCHMWRKYLIIGFLCGKKKKRLKLEIMWHYWVIVWFFYLVKVGSFGIKTQISSVLNCGQKRMRCLMILAEKWLQWWGSGSSWTGESNEIQTKRKGWEKSKGIKQFCNQSVNVMRIREWKLEKHDIRERE